MDRDADRSPEQRSPTRKAGIVVSQSPSILVVDGLSETAEVLRAVFEPRGHTVNRVRQAQLSGRISARPKVVVWHADDSSDAEPPCRWHGIPRVVIGQMRCSGSADDAAQFSQPFDYAELLRAVESLLAASQ